ncbi:MAG: N-acetylneuraminate synthase [Elusimicrobiota bacterium]
MVKIGFKYPCFVIAEAGVNHNGSLRLAKKLVLAAKKAGADAVKFQTFSADRLVLSSAPKAEYQKKNTRNSETQYQMLKKLELSKSDHIALKKFSMKNKILFLSSAFDEESLALLENLDISIHKIASGEITNLPFLEKVGKTKKPVILSTGMSNLTEVKRAVQILKKNGSKQIIVLHCLSQYPANLSEINLRAMNTLNKSLFLPVGYSDHSLGIFIPLAAVALGACVIEKHLTLNKKLEGPDHAASLEPHEFFQMVKGIRGVEKALGTDIKKVQPSEMNTKMVARKSIVIKNSLKKGEKTNRNTFVMMRPGTGLSPFEINRFIGKKAKFNLKAGVQLQPGMLR